MMRWMFTSVSTGILVSRGFTHAMSSMQTDANVRASFNANLLRLCLRARGYTLVTIPQLLRADPPPAGQPIPPSLAGD